jgi:hypothetical protein
MGTRIGRMVALLVISSLVAVACGASAANGPYAVSVASGLHPRLTADDAVRITRDYLDAQTPQIAAPELHVPPRITSVSAVIASYARSIDGCIPSEQSDQIVWVTKGQGDYLNLSDHQWSTLPSQAEAMDPLVLACGGPGPAGSIVVDDATGQIFGVYPTVGIYPHPTAQPS